VDEFLPQKTTYITLSAYHGQFSWILKPYKAIITNLNLTKVRFYPSILAVMDSKNQLQPDSAEPADVIAPQERHRGQGGEQQRQCPDGV
jgi:hypothetical protein